MPIEDMENKPDWPMYRQALGLIGENLRAGRENEQDLNDQAFLETVRAFERAQGRRPSMHELVELIMQTREWAAMKTGGPGEEDELADQTIGGLGPETDEIHPSPTKRDYPTGQPDAPNPENPNARRPSVPATTHGYGSKILYDGEIIETWP